MKNRLLKIFLLIAIAIICATTLCACFDIDDTIVDLGLYKDKKQVNNKYTVIFRECAGVSLAEDQEEILSIKSGSDAEFKIVISENYIYLGNTVGAEYDSKNGKIILENVSAPVTIDLILIPKSELYCVDVYKSNDSGIVMFEKGSAWSVEPTEISLKAIAPRGYTFRGWSSDASLDDGGILLSKEEVYSFTQTKNDRMTRIYANFDGENEYKITYNPNGGLLNGSDVTKTVSKTYSNIFMLQQTLHENNDVAVFKKENHQLIGYSTEPTTSYADYTSVNSIPGFSNLGGVCEVPRDEGHLTLYAVWAENTSSSAFTTEVVTYTDIWTTDLAKNQSATKVNQMYQKSCTGIVIKKFTQPSNSVTDTVVIPEKIDGIDVIGIASGAFANVSTVKKVVIPKTVMKIESGAFSKCTSLREVVFFDSLQYVKNDSFSSRVSTVVMNSQRLPSYSGPEGSQCIKYERVRFYRDEKKMIVVSGSSTLNGLNSKMLENNFGGEYEVINYGTNAAFSAVFLLDVISNYTTDGDIVVHAPEWAHGTMMGDTKIGWKMFRNNNQCYDIFREVNMSEYTNFWEAYVQVNIGALLYNSNPSKYSSYKEGDFAMFKVIEEYQKEDTIMNKYGDLLHDPRGDIDPIKYYNRQYRKYVAEGTMMFTTQMNSSRAANLNRVNQRITANGGQLLFSFGTADAIKVGNTDSEWKSKADEFTELCADLLDYPVISNVGTYVMGENDLLMTMTGPRQEIGNSEWHCTYYGANVRTVELTYDIQKFLSLTTKKDSYENYSERENHRNTSAYKEYSYADWND